MRGKPATGRLRALWNRLVRGQPPEPVDARPPAQKESPFDRNLTRLRDEIAELRALRAPPSARPASAAELAARVKLAKEHVERAEKHVVRFEKAREMEIANAAEWRRRAEMAVSAGGDDLALEALGRAREHDRIAATLAREIEAGRAVVAELREAIAVAEAASAAPQK